MLYDVFFTPKYHGKTSSPIQLNFLDKVQSLLIMRIWNGCQMEGVITGKGHKRGFWNARIVDVLIWVVVIIL